MRLREFYLVRALHRMGTWLNWSAVLLRDQRDPAEAQHISKHKANFISSPGEPKIRPRLHFIPDGFCCLGISPPSPASLPETIFHPHDAAASPCPAAAAGNNKFQTGSPR